MPTLTPPEASRARPAPTRAPHENRQWNVNSLNVRLRTCSSGWDVRTRRGRHPGNKVEDHKFPDTVLAEARLSQRFCRAEDYNGVAGVAAAGQRRAGGHSRFRRRTEARHRRHGGRGAHRQPVRGQRPGRGHREIRLQLRWLEACMRGWSRNCAPTRNWWCWAISTSPPMSATCTTVAVERFAHPDFSAERDALRRLYALGLHDAYRLHNEAGGSSAGGITAWPASAATWACAST